MIWKFLIPIVMYATDGGRYNTEFATLADTSITMCYSKVVMKEETRKIFTTAAKCKLPLAVALDGKNLICYQLRIETANNCFFVDRPDWLASYPYQFRIGKEDLYYTLSPKIDKDKLEQQLKADTNNKVAIVFDRNQKIQDAIVFSVNDKSADYLQANSYYQQSTPPLTFTDTAATNFIGSSEALNELVADVYKKECCEVQRIANEKECIPFRYYRTGCDKKARMVSQYLTDRGYECMILTIKSNCGIGIYITDTIIDQRIQWPLHIAVGIKYGTDTIVIDPTVFHVEGTNNLPDAATAFILRNWVGRFKVDFCEGNDGMLVTASPLSIFIKPGVYHSSNEEIAGARRRQLEHLTDNLKCNCFSSFPYYY